MQRFVHKTHILGRLCAAAMLVSAFSSCMSDGPSCPAAAEGGYTINLTLTADRPATRTVDDEDVAGTAAENFIDIAARDYAVFILDGEGKFVQRFEPGAVSLVQNADGSAAYQLRGAFIPERELAQNKIRLLVLANWTGFGGSYNDFEDQVRTSDLETVYRDAANFNFNMPAGQPGDGAVCSWVPSEDGAGIPMCGLSEPMSLTEEQPLVEFGEIWMLRSLAKIEVWDMVPGGSANIARCVLTDSNASGRFIPDGTKEENQYWNIPSTPSAQVGTPSLPKVIVSAETPLQFAHGTRNVTIDGVPCDNKDYFVVYVPEMQLTSDDARPGLQIFLKGNDDPFEVRLSDYYKGKPEDDYDALLRNHSYRYNIVGVGVNAELTLLIETPEWDLEEDEYYYEDAAAEYADGGAFSWVWSEEIRDSEENILNEQDAERRNVIVSQADPEDDERGAIATFAFAEPARGSWTLSISADDGTPNQWFRIQLWNEGEQRWVEKDQIPDAENVIASAVSGKIAPRGGTPEPVRVRIVAQGLNTSGNPYTARLVMSVSTFDGRMVEANLTDESDPMVPIGDNGHYIIKQYPISEL